VRTRRSARCRRRGCGRGSAARRHANDRDPLEWMG
jgi:hypothetical protein